MVVNLTIIIAYHHYHLIEFCNNNSLIFPQVLGIIAFALVLSHEASSLFSHYGFFIVVSALCWIGAFLIIFLHICGCCKVKILGVWQREYSLVSVSWG